MKESKFTKYCYNAIYGDNGFTDNLTTLSPEDDVATKTRGCNWRIPTYEEMQELLDNCTEEWTTINNKNGYILTSTISEHTDKSIFLPAAGYKDSDVEALETQEFGHYWTSSLFEDFSDPGHAYFLWVSKPGDWLPLEISNLQRYYGLSVRPVYDGN